MLAEIYIALTASQYFRPLQKRARRNRRHSPYARMRETRTLRSGCRNSLIRPFYQTRLAARQFSALLLHSVACESDRQARSEYFGKQGPMLKL